MLAAVIAVVVLLREVLLPFVAGAVLAYLLDPLATRLERAGMNRLVATLAIVGLFIAGVVALMALTAPIIVDEVAYFVDSVPLYLKQLRGLATDQSRPWLSKIIGEGLRQAEQSFGELTTLATGWLADFLRSVWSGGRALISVFSLSVVAPIVACYLINDWNRMIAVVDNWVPPAHRDTVRALAREIDDTIGGFVLGQGALCLILGFFYAAAFADRPQARPPYRFRRRADELRPVSRFAHRPRGIDVRRDRPVLAELDLNSDCPCDFLRRSVPGGLCALALSRRPASQLESRLGDVRVTRAERFPGSGEFQQRIDEVRHLVHAYSDLLIQLFALRPREPTVAQEL